MQIPHEPRSLRAGSLGAPQRSNELAEVRPQAVSSPEPGETFQLSAAQAPALIAPSSRADSVQTARPTASTLERNGVEFGMVAAAATLPGTVSVPLGSSFQKGFVEGYLSPKEIRERSEALAQEFPDLVEIISTGHTTSGYDGKSSEVAGPSELYYLRLGPKTAERDSKPGIFQFAAPHARELVNPMTMMELTEQLVRNFDPSSEDPEVQANTKLLQELDVFIAPMTNPDGANYALHDDPMWRKNRAPIDDQHSGVDINRNFPYQWEPSTRPGSQTYPGSGPASEPETQAIISVVDRHPNIQFVVDWHSYGQDIRRPLVVEPKDDRLYDELHGRVSEAIASVAGNRYKPINSQIVAGTSDDYFYNQRGLISTVVETGTAFAPPTAEALVQMEESVAGAREFLAATLDLSSREDQSQA